MKGGSKEGRSEEKRRVEKEEGREGGGGEGRRRRKDLNNTFEMFSYNTVIYNFHEQIIEVDLFKLIKIPAYTANTPSEKLLWLVFDKLDSLRNTGSSGAQ